MLNNEGISEQELERLKAELLKSSAGFKDVRRNSTFGELALNKIVLDSDIAAVYHGQLSMANK